MKELRMPAGAFAVAGHHGGLPNGSAGKKPKIEKKIYIIVCAALVFLLAAVVALILIITTGGKKDSKTPEKDAVSDAEEEPASSPDPGPMKE